MPVTWPRTRFYDNDFESDDWLSSWSAGSFTRTSAQAVEGTYSADIASGSYATKYVNAVSYAWLRWYWKIPVASADGDLLVLTAAGSTLTIGYDTAEDELVFAFPDASHYAERQTAFQCVEIGLDLEAGSWQFYLDGTYITTGTWGSASASHIYLHFTAEDGVPFYLDAVAVDRNRVGLLPPIGPHVGGFVYAQEIEIDGVGYSLAPQAQAFQKRALSAFNPRLGVGAPKYSDLSGFQHHVMESFHNGIGQPEFSDEFSYLFGVGLDTTDVGMARLANAIGDHDTGKGLDTWSLLSDGFICAESSEIFSVFGLGFHSAAPSASYSVLYAYDGNDSQTYEFTCTQGVQDILDNGKYLFVTLGGVRMQKSSLAAGGISFSDGPSSDSIRFDADTGVDSILFSPIFVFSNVGSDALPPTDMGQMTIYDEFLWVAERDAPYLHRAGQVDGSDLEGGNPDDDVSYDIMATRIGGGYVPITAMCPYLDRLYIGREDGLYRLWMDGEQVYVDLVEQVTRHRDNYRGMAVYNGLLTYAANGRVYQFNGTSKMDVTPGPLSNSYPYIRFQRYAGFWPHNRYLFSVATTDDDSVAKPTWYIVAFTQSGWHVLGELDTGRVNALPMPIVTKETKAGGANSFRVGLPLDSDGQVHLFEQDTRHGAQGSGPYQSSGYLISSAMDFGLPEVDRMLSLIRSNIQSLEEGTNRATFSYTLDNEVSEETLGTIAAADCNFLPFSEVTVCRKVALKVELQTDDTDYTPILKTFVIQYMDRPETVWGYTLVLDLSAPARQWTTQGGSYSANELKRRLEVLRDERVPVSFREPGGDTATVFLTDIGFTEVGGRGAERRLMANMVLMATTSVSFIPPVVGLAYEVS